MPTTSFSLPRSPAADRLTRSVSRTGRFAMGIVIAIIIVVVILAIAFWAIGGYNGLVRGRNAYKNAFAQIDVQLQRRFDLIPNLVETAKAYMQYEKCTLEAVVQARGAAMAGLSAARSDLTDAAAMQQLAQ